jgi:3alpha(or 20beta)-hydroxysteroid dehydrogenase
LNGKVALVTGGASGMGKAHATLMASLGAKVILTDIDETGGRAAADAIGENAHFVRLDVSSSEDWQQGILEAEDRFGSVNVLVNNAGIALAGSLVEFDEAVFHQTMAVNATGVALGMAAILPSMTRAGGGSIVNISSIAGLYASPASIGYTASKAAVTAMTRAAAANFAPFGIRVNSVHPGFVETPMIVGKSGDVDGLLKRIRPLLDRVPLGRIARVDELSPLIVFLASDESSYCTGAEFIADGGLTSQF